MNGIGYTGFGEAVFAIIGIWSLVGIGIYVWYLWSLSRLFPYLGLPSAHGWIPVWNQWRLVERGGLPGWLVLLGFIPGLSIVVLVVSIIAIHRINQEHGESAGMTVLGALIAPLWATLLGSRLRDRGYVPQAQPAAAAYGVPPAAGWQPPAQQQGFVEYGPDGQVYPLLGSQQAPAQPAAEQAPQQVDSGWALPPVPPMAPNVNQAPAAPAPPVVPAPPSAPAQANPWGLSNTVDNNFERLAQEPLAPRDGSFGSHNDSRPFAWPEPQPQTPVAPQTPATPQARQAAPAPAAYEPPPAPVPEPVTPAQPAYAAPVPPAAPAAAPAAIVEPLPEIPVVPAAPAALAASAAPAAFEDEDDATVVTGGVNAPIEMDDDNDHTIVVSRKTVWVLELPDASVLELPSDDVVIGRRPQAIDGSAALIVPDSTRTLSKSHARLRRTGESWTIEDLNSTNGVFVIDGDNQVEATPGVQIAATEQLIIGTLEVRLRVA